MVQATAEVMGPVSRVEKLTVAPATVGRLIKLMTAARWGPFLKQEPAPALAAEGATLELPAHELLRAERLAVGGR